MARSIHPLLRTRGVPGTHDVALGLRVIDALERGEAALLPRFDKASDDRLPEARWERAAAGTRLLLLEGWCAGAQPTATAGRGEQDHVLDGAEAEDGVRHAVVTRRVGGG